MIDWWLMIPNNRKYFDHRRQYFVRKRLGFRVFWKVTKSFFYFVNQTSLPISLNQKYRIVKHDSLGWLGARNVEGTLHVGLNRPTKVPLLWLLVIYHPQSLQTLLCILRAPRVTNFCLVRNIFYSNLHPSLNFHLSSRI